MKSSEQDLGGVPYPLGPEVSWRWRSFAFQRSQLFFFFLFTLDVPGHLFYVFLSLGVKPETQLNREVYAEMWLCGQGMPFIWVIRAVHSDREGASLCSVSQDLLSEATITCLQKSLWQRACFTAGLSGALRPLAWRGQKQSCPPSIFVLIISRPLTEGKGGGEREWLLRVVNIFGVFPRTEQGLGWAACPVQSGQAYSVLSLCWPNSSPTQHGKSTLTFSQLFQGNGYEHEPWSRQTWVQVSLCHLLAVRQRQIT